MIEVKELTKTFSNNFNALDSISMTVPTGSIYGLVGPNGSGKTTLIKHLTGIIHQNEGQVLVDGEPVWENLAIKSKIAYVPDEIFYFLQSNIHDLMKYYRGIYPNFDTERYGRLKAVFTELDEKKNIRTMSKGMQKQAELWLQMCLRAEIVVLDEPVDGLDPVMRRTVWNLLLADARERGVTILVSSHNLRELEDVCDHIGILNHGKMLLERALVEMQENICKFQLLLPEDTDLPAGLPLVHHSNSGQMKTIICRGNREETLAMLKQTNPLYIEAFPLTMEEIFIYELGGDDNAVKDILL